jgi:hypothetical protein
MHLADGTQRHSIQAHGLQYLLTVRQHFVVYTAVEAEIELLARTPGVAGRKGATQPGRTVRERWCYIRHGRRFVPV